MSITTSMPQSNFLSLLDPIIQTMPTWFQEGGVVMWPLLLISFLITVVALERLYFWVIYHSQKERFLLQECFAALYNKQKTEALLVCKKLETPALKMISEGISMLPFPPKEKMLLDTKKQINLVSRGQSFLHKALIVTPILGILGTLINLINAFSSIELQESENIGVLLKTITESLIPIAASLIILLFILIPQQFFRTQIYKITLHLENVRSQFDHICLQKNLIRNNFSENMGTMVKNDENTLDEERKDCHSKSVSEQTQMPYHYEFSEETGEINVSIHEQTEDIKRVPTSSIAEMYNNELLTVENTEYESTIVENDPVPTKIESTPKVNLNS
ncbi:MotA/TolQ/ExbB proton channel family protein [Psychromonas sp. L1A2]|uniref:MotA/TolQ/ExbB proton channel family protein n=1 Tax=Psychromonas sp. L1A2 TaxID=2686356 RepID=UPI00135AD917|nr:MotA/TolQ/ExbB proton channel family protein [Psychromonas sp. L1A2]